MKEFIEKLIGRFEERIKENTNEDMSYKIPYFGLEIALNIVNQLAEEYNNDFCVWKSEKDMFIQNPHTGRKFSNEPSMRNIYCNTCGKKIKVAPYQPKGE